jgi:hypothetical protein
MAVTYHVTTWELNSGPLEELSVILTAESSLQPYFGSFNWPLDDRSPNLVCLGQTVMPTARPPPPMTDLHTKRFRTFHGSIFHEVFTQMMTFKAWKRRNKTKNTSWSTHAKFTPRWQPRSISEEIPINSWPRKCWKPLLGTTVAPCLETKKKNFSVLKRDTVWKR